MIFMHYVLYYSLVFYYAIVIMHTADDCGGPHERRPSAASLETKRTVVCVHIDSYHNHSMCIHSSICMDMLDLL